MCFFRSPKSPRKPDTQKEPHNQRVSQEVLWCHQRQTPPQEIILSGHLHGPIEIAAVDYIRLFSLACALSCLSLTRPPTLSLPSRRNESWIPSPPAATGDSYNSLPWVHKVQSTHSPTRKKKTSFSFPYLHEKESRPLH